MLNRHVENLLNYLSSILFEAFTQRPESLRSGDKVEVATVLGHNTIESLVRFLAERRVEALSYRSFADLQEFFRTRFALEIADPDVVDDIVEAIETRNISVHNRCRINRRYVTRTGSGKERLGELRELGIHTVAPVSELMLRTVRTLDARFRRKLRLAASRCELEPLFLPLGESADPAPTDPANTP